MSRRASGSGPADERGMADSRRLADEVPRWSAGEQSHPDESHVVDTDDRADDFYPEYDSNDVLEQLPHRWNP